MLYGREAVDVEIRPLGEAYRGKTLEFAYVSDRYFDVRMEEESSGWRFLLCEKPFERPMEKRVADKLLSEWLENPVLFGAFVEGAAEPVGFLEVSHESWNNRLRISNLLVREAYRGRGVGARLFEEAQKTARALKARAIVLETQSCNAPAIRFYQKMGMRLIGLDTCAYSNEDVQKCEVRLEFAMLVKEKE